MECWDNGELLPFPPIFFFYKLTPEQSTKHRSPSFQSIKLFSTLIHYYCLYLTGRQSQAKLWQELTTQPSVQVHNRWTSLEAHLLHVLGHLSPWMNAWPHSYPFTHISIMMFSSNVSPGPTRMLTVSDPGVSLPVTCMDPLLRTSYLLARSAEAETSQSFHP